MSESDVQAIVERLRRGRCVLCAGGRLTQRGERDVSFRGLVAKMLTNLPEAEKSDAMTALDVRPLAAAGFIRRRLGDKFAPALKLATASTAELPEVVQLLGALPFRAVVTTAY